MTEKGLVVVVEQITELTNEPYPDWCNKYFRGTKWNDNTDQFDYILTEHLQKAKIFLDNPVGRKNAEVAESILKISLGKKAKVSIAECVITTLDKLGKKSRPDIEEAMKLLRANGFNVEPPM